MRRYNVAVCLLCTFFVVSLGLAFFFNRNFPIQAVGAESSVGTWVSGVLLSCCAAVVLVIGMNEGWRPWAFLTIFFFLLAADEHFMFHERMKEWIIFSYTEPSLIFRESPAIFGALVGAAISWMLWTRLKSLSRMLLLVAVLLGGASVVLDVAGISALPEEILKLMAELAIGCALMARAGEIGRSTD
jgi:hypothetical protein